MNKTIRCYNCGRELSKNEITKEHIPAKNLFEGYSEKHLFNRITVPACFNCNNKYSHADEAFRNMIGIISNHKENISITTQTIKSINRNKHKYIFWTNQIGKIYGIETSLNLIFEYHKKNFKGLFYHQYGYPLPENYEIKVTTDEIDSTDFTKEVNKYLTDNFKLKHSGHPNIFSYCIQPLRLRTPKSDKEDLAINENEDVIVGRLIYNQEHVALVFAANKLFLEKLKSAISE